MATAVLLTLLAAGDWPLSCTHFSPQRQSCPNTPLTSPVVLLAPATGVPRSFYTSFLQYIALSAETDCFTFDYRLTGGKGGSWGHGVDSESAEARLDALKRGKATRITEEWRLDYTAVLAYVLDLAGSREVVVVGHSLGGHLLQLVDPRLSSRVARSMWIGVVNPHVDFDIRAIERRQFAEQLIKNSQKGGFFPSSSIAMGHDIPSAAGEEWFGYSISEATRSQYMHSQYSRLAKFSTPVFSIAFNDDALCRSDVAGVGGPRVWDNILEHISNRATRVIFDPIEQGWGEVGHVNGFQKRHEATVWPIFLAYIMRGEMLTEDGGKVREFRDELERESRL